MGKFQSIDPNGGIKKKKPAQAASVMNKNGKKSAGADKAAAEKSGRNTAPRGENNDTRAANTVEKGYYIDHACEEAFVCRHCGRTVQPEGAGTDHRNHCPNCLYSLHLDNEPGDRASDCGGQMDPIAVWVRKGGEWAIIHRCTRCGALSSNRIAADDNPMLLMSIAMRPISQPPFPLERIEEMTKMMGYSCQDDNSSGAMDASQH